MDAYPAMAAENGGRYLLSEGIAVPSSCFDQAAASPDHMKQESR